MGLIGYYLFPVVAGGTTYGFAPLDFLKRPALWFQIMSRVKATYASSPNFGFEYCLRPGKIVSEQLRDIDLSSVRVLMNAAEPVRIETLEAFAKRFHPYGLKEEFNMVAYGLAENTLAATHHGKQVVCVNKRSLSNNVARIEEKLSSNVDQVRLISCGKPVEGTSIRIVEPESRVALPDLKVGEIWLSGLSVCRGYWSQPKLSKATFRNKILGDQADSRTYLRTGDLGFMHNQELFVCGRLKDLIIVRGVNYYPEDIEAVVESACPKVRRRGVAAITGKDDAEALVVVVEVKNTTDLPDPEIIACAIRRQCYVEANTILLVPPRTTVKTTSGKKARSLTRKLFLDNDLPNILIHYSSTECPAWPDSFNLKDRFPFLSALTDKDGYQMLTFSELGFDSLMLTDIQMDLERVLRESKAGDLIDDIDISLLQRLTIGMFSRLLDQLEDASESAISTCRKELRSLKTGFESEVHMQMRADTRLTPLDLASIDLQDEPIENVLLTGPTGFFGPFLLNSLLRETEYTYYALTRADNPKHGMERIRSALRKAKIWTPSLDQKLESRVRIVCGDLEKDNLGLPTKQWISLARRIHAVIHNGAFVNYVLNYDVLKPANVDGTRTLLQFSHTARRKEFHYISTTFIFGWTVKGFLCENDNNDEMAGLDFGYAQTKWVAEQMVLAAEKSGIKVRIYRPSLISASSKGIGDISDVAIRLLSFMINHGIAVDTTNQVSILPADIAADNIASIFKDKGNAGRTYHVTVDQYYNMTDITRIISSDYGYTFTYFNIPNFIAEINLRCTKEDPLYSLLDFFNRSASKIAVMQLKRYRNVDYRQARTMSGIGRGDPLLQDTVAYLVTYMRGEGLIQ